MNPLPYLASKGPTIMIEPLSEEARFLKSSDSRYFKSISFA